MMKKLIYIFCVAFLAVACVEPLEPVISVDNEPEDGAKVTLEFSLPPMTKGAMGHNPTISTIHVAVFTQTGVLKQYEQATLVNPENLTNGSNASNPKYSVDIHMSSSKRILHFVADSPIATYDQLVALAGTTGEDAVMNALTTTGGATAYWQRFELDKIDAYTYQGGIYTTPDGIQWGSEGATFYKYTENGQEITVFRGDYIKRNGHKVLDGTGYFQSTAVATKLAVIPFVRNFAEITVSSAATTNFTPKYFALVNVPEKGYVAPFDTEEGVFCSAYINAGTAGLTHPIVAETHYPGSLVGGIDTSKPTSFIDLTATEADAVKTAYMYERRIPSRQQPATCILVGGVFNAENANKDANGNTWFKIEIADADGGYFPIYRALSYDVKIGTISGTHGYADPQDAYDNEPIGDVSGSVTTATLEQISDGRGTTMWVQYIDYVATGETSADIYYTMYYDNGSTREYLYNTISFPNDPTHPENNAVTHPDESRKAITGAVTIASGTFNTGTPDDDKVWKKATVPLATPGQNTLRSILRIQGTAHTGKPMYREVNYRVMGTQLFQNGNNVLTASSLASEDIGEMTLLTIYLPSDLGFSMFPLTLRIEAEKANFTTVDGLPVESGSSLFNTNKNSFYFLKTIDYDEYKNSADKAFKARFKTTRAGSTAVGGTNATKFRVLDKVKEGRENPYFAPAECTVSVGDPAFILSADNVVLKAGETTATFDVISHGAANANWTLTASDGATVSPDAGTGKGTVTVTLPSTNENTTEVKTYTITASRTGFEDQVLTIIQQPKPAPHFTIDLDAGGSSDTYGWVESKVNPDSDTYYSYQSNNYHKPSTIATMSVTVSGYTEFKVYIRSNGQKNNDYVVVRKMDGEPLTSWIANGSHSDPGTKAHTRGTSSSGIELINYTEVTFTTSDGLTDDDTPHTFYIQYGKDNGLNDYLDRGFVLIPKS